MHRDIRRSIALLVAFTFASSLVTTNAALAANIDEPFKKLFSGIASWYGGKFHGRRTASGTRYNMHSMTCAHKTLPFGTKLLVKNPSNGKTCQVTVTDRGPYYGKRVIDLSKAAADRLELDGIGHVVCYLGKAVGKGIGGAAKGIGGAAKGIEGAAKGIEVTAKGIEGTAKETGETIANLPGCLGKVAKEIGETAAVPISRGVTIASKPMNRQAYRKEIERYYKSKDFVDDGVELAHWEVKGTFEPRAKTGCLLVPEAGYSGTSKHNRSVISGLDQDIF